MNNSLSVIVPVYNVEKYLKKCIESILSQTFSDFELILVDDGSTDSSGVICDEYARIDERIKVIHKTNGGLVSARVAGVMSANYDYVTFVDSDDWIAEETYKTMMQAVEDTQADVACFACVRYWDDSDYINDICYRFDEGIYNREDIDEVIIPRMLYDKAHKGWALDPSLCMKIFRRDLLVNEYKILGNNAIYYGEDAMVIYPLVLKCSRILITHNLFYYHRHKPRGTAISYFENANFFDDFYVLYKVLKDCFMKYKNPKGLIEQLDFHYLKNTNCRVAIYGDDIDNYYGDRVYLFPFKETPKDCRIAIYGAGKVGRQFVRQIEATNYCNLTCWVDKNSQIEGVKKPEVLLQHEKYDYVIIALAKDSIVEEVKTFLSKLGVPKYKVLDYELAYEQQIKMRG